MDPFLAGLANEHQQLAGPKHDVVSHVVAVDLGLASRVDIEPVGELLPDIPDGHVGHRELLAEQPVADPRRW